MHQADAVSPRDPIELRLREVSQLFNTLDPFPFRERDLAPEAIEYIIDWAQELPKDSPIHIAVHVPSGGQPSVQADIAGAIKASFAAMGLSQSRAIRQLFRDGKMALLIAIPVLASCTFLALKLSVNLEGPLARIATESFVIIGWVVLWRPVEMFLYDWLPLVRRRNLCRRLAAARVTVCDDENQATSAGGVAPHPPHSKE
jgi:hypothetical protein